MRLLSRGLGLLVAASFTPLPSSGPTTLWSLRDGKGVRKEISATVPGTVHKDLISAGVLEQDPLYRFNELEYQWVTEDSWVYSTELPLQPQAEPEGTPWLLRFDGIDTVAEVRLDGRVLGQTDNFFQIYTFELPEGALDARAGVAEGAGPRLEVEIKPALAEADKRRAESSYPIPETTFSHTWTNDSGRNFLRKPASDFGWDWGPAFIPSGLPGRVTLLRLSPLGEVVGVLVHQQHAEDGSVSLDVVTRVSRVAVPAKAVLTLRLEGQEPLHTPISLVAGDNAITHTIRVDKPALWWPAGMGEARLLSLSVELRETSSDDRAPASQLTRKIGLRHVELVEEPVKGSEGLSFYFRVNGRPLFVRGANLIPFSVFGDQSEEDMDWVLTSAVEANMNMVRVWGGGYYLPDAFYELADAKGLLIWQEIMLACALYPRTDDFLESVREEVTQQMWRLQSHASIALWGGSNENEASLDWYHPSKANRDLYAIDYQVLYVETVYPIVSKLDPFTPWVDSSPSSGLVSRHPYVKRWGNPYDANYGDLHYYDYYKDCEVPENFPSSRFVSEFGFQSLPSLETYAKVLGKGDMRRDSDLLAFRQRHEEGNEQIELMLDMHFNLPPVAPTAGAPPTSQEQLLDDFIYLTQVQQARCYETAITKWRRAKITTDATMGILYWQLNDLWQGPTWSSMEYGGKWKALHYVIKRVYAPLLLSGHVDNSSILHVHLISDLPVGSKVEGQLTMELHSLTAKAAEDGSLPPLLTWTEDVSISDGGAELIEGPSRKYLGNGRFSEYDSFLHITFTPTNTTDKTVAPISTDVFFSTFKESTLGPAKLTVTSVAPLADKEGFTVTLQSTGVAAYVLLEARGLAGRFSDNAFLMLPGREYSVDFHPRDASSAVTPEQFKAALSLRSLSDVMPTPAAGEKAPVAADKGQGQDTSADMWMAEARRKVQSLRGGRSGRVERRRVS